MKLTVILALMISALGLAVFFSHSNSQDEAGICDKKTPEFGECMSDVFGSTTLAEVDEFLKSEGFVRAQQQADEAYHYYRWSEGGLANYKVVVLVYLSAGRDVEQIRVNQGGGFQGD